MDSKRVLWIGPSLPPEAALETLRQIRFDAVVCDFPLPGWAPAELLDKVLRLAPEVPVLVRDPGATLADAVRLARLGVYQCLGPDDDVHAQIDLAVQEGRASAPAGLDAHFEREEWERLLVGESSGMRQVCHIIRMVGSRRSTVLITGETGTGKEMAARALHLAGSRRNTPWIAVNCSALPENLLEAELFGHVKGAFTGAFQNRVGRFEQAQGGTLFLDEIGDLPLELQAKILRVLQERELQRLGSSETVRLDIRVVAATNCDLPRRIEQGRFREDLYYRLNVVPILMPPLRRRREDIPMLAMHFLDKICRLEAIQAKLLRPEAMERLCDYSWPGNVRQLENAVEMAVALSGDRHALMAGDFPLPAPASPRIPVRPGAPLVSVPDDGLDYEHTLAIIERSILQQALEKTGGNKKAAAEMLRLKRTTLSAKMRSLEAAVCN